MATVRGSLYALKQNARSRSLSRICGAVPSSVVPQPAFSVRVGGCQGLAHTLLLKEGGAIHCQTQSL